MNYYLITIIFLVSTFFLLSTLIFNIYGYEISKVNYLNEIKNVGFIPIKNKILPQYEEVSDTQSKNQTKPQLDLSANDIHKSNNSTKSVANTSPGIKILSPVSGKEIPVGNLTIFGISTDSEKSNCSVYVDWNNQEPFQEATAAGPYGNDDYSSWTFTYSPSYHTIENGINDLTSKLECEKNSKVTTKWHSINVTGVITNDTKPTTTLIYHDPLGILPQLKTLSTNPTASTTSIANNETMIQPLTKLSANLVVSKDQIFPGDTQNITVEITDSKTLQHVAGANVSIKVMQGSAKLNEYNGTADTSGAYSHSWNIGSDTQSGKYDVLVSASANGYAVSKTGSFQVQQRQLLGEASLSKGLVVPGDNQTQQRQLLVEASLSKGLVVPGDNQTIDVKVMDANTKEIVSGANVIAKIGGKNEYKGTADTSGAYSHSWNIGSDTQSGKYDVLVSASANGYEPVSKTESFQVQQGQLLVEASLSKGLVVPGDKQTIDVKVMDANTKEIVSGANVIGKIGTKKFSSNTDDSGAITYSWDTSPTSGENSYQIGLDVSSKGYPKVTKTVSFKMDKPQSLLEPPISNQENKVVNVKNKDLNIDLESQNKFQECSNMLSNVGCSPDVSDKPTPNPATDDKPTPNPTTDDKPTPNPTTDDKPTLNVDNGIENIQSEENENENNVHDFLASVTKLK